MTPAPDTAMVTADGLPLKLKLRQAERRKKLTAFLLVTPLLLFIIVTFVVPIFDMMRRSIDNPEIGEVLPRTTEALQAWDGRDLPPESVYAAFAADMVEGRENRTTGRVATRLNYEISGMRSAVNSTARRAARLEAPFKESLLETHARWGDPYTWQVIQRESGRFTASYYLSALDLRYDESGRITLQPDEQRIYLPLALRTFWLSGLVTVITLILGFPVAYMLATLPLRYSNLLMILVLLPFWTSLLVRTTSWIVILQSQGVFNDIVAFFFGEGARMQLMHNQIGTVIAMSHILLPFMILPLYSVMKTIPPGYMRAARSLGANPFTAFRRVYLPQTIPGIGAGALLVFILSIGYYITPALVGGRTGQLVGNLVAFHIQNSLNWGLAAALGTLLLGSVVILYFVYNRLIGIDNMKLG
ncbi:MAG TPA: ABC transporter permease [Azoarcus taiwanensis]|nr:ABC transporter permease [Azoarcus taiwanensis]